ncbi:MAG: fluoride efflux transporter CrcB [Phycisphaerales bacterium]|nr:fluoride efflux transporter CrcB [Phycisphaerales bacterium]
MDMPLVQRVGLLALAGAAGTLARFGVYALVAAAGWARLPIATLAVNVLGCLAFGLVWALAEQHDRVPETAKWLLLTGFMGAFTTFSTFAFDTGRLFSQGQPALAIANILLSNVLGLGAFFAGSWLAGRV